MSKNTKKQDNLFISTQQDAQQAQLMMPADSPLNFKVENSNEFNFDRLIELGFM